MGRWLANVFRLGCKEFASLASDKVLAIFIVYSFSFAIYSHATGVQTEVANAPVAVVDADRSRSRHASRTGFSSRIFVVRSSSIVPRSTARWISAPTHSCSKFRPARKLTCCAGVFRRCNSISTRPP